VDVTAWSKGLSVEVGGHGVVSHVGSGLLRLLADLAVMIADDGTTISEIENRHGAIPPARVAGEDLGGVTVIRLDASIVLAHSDKQQAGLTFNR
jgi:hypothetical protein